MKEIEVKILDVNPDDVVKTLNKLGAVRTEVGLVTVKAFDFPDDRLRKNKEFVRVRKIADRVELVHKQRISKDDAESKICEETQVNVSDFETTCALFQKLGMKMFCDMEKFRATYTLGNAKIEFDKHEGIPWFLEVEAPTQEDVNRVVQQLGFNISDSSKVTALPSPLLFGESLHSLKFKEGEGDYSRIFDKN